MPGPASRGDDRDTGDAVLLDECDRDLTTSVERSRTMLRAISEIAVAITVGLRSGEAGLHRDIASTLAGR